MSVPRIRAWVCVKSDLNSNERREAAPDEVEQQIAVHGGRSCPTWSWSGAAVPAMGLVVLVLAEVLVIVSLPRVLALASRAAISKRFGKFHRI